MATQITTGLNTLPSIYAGGAGSLLNPLVYQAMDAVSGNAFVPSGRTMLFIRNTDSATHTFFINGITDQYGVAPSTGVITVPALGTAGGEVVMGPFPIYGPWAQGGGSVIINPSSALLYVAVLTLPG